MVEYDPVYPLTVCLHKTTINHAGHQPSLYPPGKTRQEDPDPV